jgi:hypothetical protein
MDTFVCLGTVLHRTMIERGWVSGRVRCPPAPLSGALLPLRWLERRFRSTGTDESKSLNVYEAVRLVGTKLKEVMYHKQQCHPMG